MFESYNITGERDCLIFSVAEFDIGENSEPYRRKNATREACKIKHTMESLNFNVVEFEGFQNGNITERSANAGNSQSDLLN